MAIVEKSSVDPEWTRDALWSAVTSVLFGGLAAVSASFFSFS